MRGARLSLSHPPRAHYLPLPAVRGSRPGSAGYTHHRGVRLGKALADKLTIEFGAVRRTNITGTDRATVWAAALAATFLLGALEATQRRTRNKLITHTRF